MDLFQAEAEKDARTESGELQKKANEVDTCEVDTCEVDTREVDTSEVDPVKKDVKFSK